MSLELYYFESCPYCQKVLRFLEGKKHEIVFKDTRQFAEYRTELSRINSGNTQVPCLVIDGNPMLESDDIIDYLKNTL